MLEVMIRGMGMRLTKSALFSFAILLGSQQHLAADMPYYGSQPMPHHFQPVHEGQYGYQPAPHYMHPVAMDEISYGYQPAPIQRPFDRSDMPMMGSDRPIRRASSQGPLNTNEDKFSFTELNVGQGPQLRPLRQVTMEDLKKMDLRKNPPHKDPSSALYQLDIGDRFSVAIYGEPNTERYVIVDSAGTITYPIVGTLEVYGKTFDQVRREMDERIRKIYRYTFVSLTPIEFGGQSYTILGWVNVPGKKSLLGRETVLSALCRAGGFPAGTWRSMTIDLADLEHAFLLRGSEYISVNFKKLVQEGDTKSDVPLQPGDYIYIPSSLEKEIYVLGEVPMPATLGYLNKVTLAQAITMVGGLTFNASSRVLVVRGSLNEPYTFYIDFKLIEQGCEPDFLLRPGDIVYVPPRTFTTFRELVEYAVRIFVSTAASQAGAVSWASITNGVAIEPVNVIPNINVNGIVSPSPVMLSP